MEVTNTFDIQVGVELPAEVVPRFPGEVLMENNVARAYLRGADFERWGLSEGCLGCWYLRTGQGPQQALQRGEGRQDAPDWLWHKKDSIAPWLTQ